MEDASHHDAPMTGPQLVWQDAYSSRGYEGGRYAVLPPHDEHDDTIHPMFVESREEGLLYLVEEYVLNFSLPLWDAGTGLLRAEPTPIGCWARYGQENLYADICHWAGEISPGTDVDDMIEATGGEVWRRIAENGGWNGKLTLLSWRCARCGAHVESMAERCPGCGVQEYHDLP